MDKTIRHIVSRQGSRATYELGLREFGLARLRFPDALPHRAGRNQAEHEHRLALVDAVGVGLLNGGYGEDELARAGALRVYEDPADMLKRIDEVAARA